MIHLYFYSGARQKYRTVRTMESNLNQKWALNKDDFIANKVQKKFLGIEGNAYPLGALAIGTKVNSVERYIVENPTYPGDDSEVLVCLAGSCAEVVRRQGDYVVIRVTVYVNIILLDIFRLLFILITVLKSEASFLFPFQI